MDDEKLRYERAKLKVQKLKEFYEHLIVYLLVNLGIFLFNMVISPETLWFYYSLVGWGVGLAIHAVFAFGLADFWGSDWEERKIKELMAKDK